MSTELMKAFIKVSPELLVAATAVGLVGWLFTFHREALIGEAVAQGRDESSIVLDDEQPQLRRSARRTPSTCR